MLVTLPTSSMMPVNIKSPGEHFMINRCESLKTESTMELPRHGGKLPIQRLISGKERIEKLKIGDWKLKIENFVSGSFPIGIPQISFHCEIFSEAVQRQCPDVSGV